MPSVGYLSVSCCGPLFESPSVPVRPSVHTITSICSAFELEALDVFWENTILEALTATLELNSSLVATRTTDKTHFHIHSTHNNVIQTDG
jgi:hypothetical protein